MISGAVWDEARRDQPASVPVVLRFRPATRPTRARIFVDVRRYPGSRAHPHFSRPALTEWLPQAGIDYRWEERLGGRRRMPAESPDAWWQVTAFRAYAAHMRTVELLDAVHGLLTEAAAARMAVMCSESLWWRCHRRLIADYVGVVGRTQVCHLFHDGHFEVHRVAAGARLSADGVLFYDVPHPAARRAEPEDAV